MLLTCRHTIGSLSRRLGFLVTLLCGHKTQKPSLKPLITWSKEKTVWQSLQDLLNLVATIMPTIFVSISRNETIIFNTDQPLPVDWRKHTVFRKQTIAYTIHFFLIFVGSIAMAGNVLGTIGQQQNGIRTVSPTDVMQGTALASINLTQGYFNRVSDALNNARQELQNNDFLSAYG